MRINEVSEKCNITKRAIKYYEEKHLIKIKKDENGYRCYTTDDVKRLKEINCYRKLDIEIQKIKEILEYPERKHQILSQIYEEKQKEQLEYDARLKLLRQLIDEKTDDYENIEEKVDYLNIAHALKDMVPGSFGDYLFYHFQPYLQIKLESEEQKDAYRNILAFCDRTNIKIPWNYRFALFIQKKTNTSLEKQTLAMDQKLQSMLHPTEEEYEKAKSMMIKQAKLRKHWFIKYQPAMIMHRTGKNPMVIDAAKRLKESGIKTLSISCNSDMRLANITDENIQIMDGRNQLELQTTTYTVAVQYVLDICISSLMLHHMDTIEEVYSKLMNARAEWQNEKMK